MKRPRAAWSLTLLATLAAPLASVAWTPPLGVPQPAWPSDLDLARPALPSPWSSTQAGFYFVAGSGCSDANGNGTPAAPRCSLPGSVSAGSVIVLDGTLARGATINYTGSASNPVWVMGRDAANRPKATAPWDIAGAYVIVDSIAFELDSQDGVDLRGRNIMLRNSTMKNTFGASNGAAFGIDGEKVIFYKNVVSQSGNWLHNGADIDRHGIKVSGNDTWIVDSQFFHIQGDGVQIGDYNNRTDAINRIYVGRNLAYENLQFGFWVKNATDVIFSQNTAYNLSRSTDSGPGGGLGGQYDPRYVWFIANTVHDSNNGIHIAGTGNGGGGPWYAIGNLVTNIPTGTGSCGAYDAGAISYRNDGGFTAIFNTIDKVDFFGGFPPSGGTVTLRDNIFASKKANACDAFASERTLASDYNVYGNAGYRPGAEAHAIVGDPRFNAPGTDYSLQAGSPALDAASPIEEAAFAVFQARYGLDIRRDLAGTARPQRGKWDAGAYEARAPTGTRPAAPTGLSAH